MSAAALLAIDPDGEPLRPGSIPTAALLAFGGERQGLSPELRARAERRLALPMRPRVSSLNLAMAVAVALTLGDGASRCHDHGWTTRRSRREPCGRLEGKTALITGAGRGIGRAAALAVRGRGRKVAIAELAAADGGRPRGDRDAGGEALFVETDVAEPGASRRGRGRRSSAFGGLHVLYNNAGGATPRDGKVTEIALDEFWRTIGVDLFGTFLGCRFAIPVMVEGGGGSIINTTSIRAMIGTAGADAYTSAKGGVRALTQALALQWAAKTSGSTRSRRA